METATIGGVYVVVQDMDRAQRFYEAALGLTTKFRDRSSWCQFDTGKVSFSLSSPDEAATNAVGAVALFKSSDPESVREQVKNAGGHFVASRDMGSHGAVLTFADPDRNLFQVLIPNAAP